MPDISLGLQNFSDDHGLMPEIKMVNLYFEPIPNVLTQNMSSFYRRKRPGIINVSSDNTYGSTVCISRPVGIFNSDLFTVCQSSSSYLTLYRIDSSNIKTTIGSVSTYVSTSTLPTIKMIYTQFGLIILNDQNELYVYTTAGVLQSITVPESYVPQDICTIDNYLLILCTTGRVYYLEPNEWVFTDDNASGDDSGNTDSVLNYFTAESLPDGGIAIANVRGNIYIFGQLTTEIWQTTGSSDSPFSKAQGLDLMKGAVDRKTVQLFDNTAVWIGQDSVIYRADSVPLRISTHNIEVLVKNSTYYNSWTWTLAGHLFYVIQLDTRTLAYDASTKMWSTLQTGTSDIFEYMGYQDLDDVLLYSQSNRNISKFDLNTYNDNGNPMTCIVNGIVATDTPIQIKNLVLHTSQSSAAQYSLQYRTPYNQTYQNNITLSSNRSGMTKMSTFLIGQVVPPFKEFLISTSSDCDINIMTLEYNLPSMWSYQ